jgi:4-diphosphocytidyl-2-C-methyl-D-erythritol kinase
MLASRVALEAPAKINLYLEVGPRLSDGFHPVTTVMQAVELCDRLEIELEPDGSAISLEVEGDAPPGDENLCMRAAEVFFARWEKSAGVRIRLDKRIPAAAGLGGGSSDAAAVLRGLQILCEEEIGRQEFFDLAASLGSDVPFFLIGGTVLGTGRGERILPLVQAPPLPVLLVNPGSALSTQSVYERFDEIGGDDPPESGAAAVVECLASQDMEKLPSKLFNSLQKAAVDLAPGIGEIIEKASGWGADRCLVSGSGPTIFFMQHQNMGSLYEQAKQAAPWVLSTNFRSNGVALLESS